DTADSQDPENDLTNIIYDHLPTAEAEVPRETIALGDDSYDEGSGESEYEEEESYIVLDLGTEVTLDMITTNDSLVKNIYNPSTYHFTSFAASNFPVRSPEKDNGEEGSGTQDGDSSSARKVAVGDEGDEGDGNQRSKKEEITYSLIGLDTENPRLRIGNMHFKGEYDESVGTDLIFLQDPDPSNPRQQMLTYDCHTTKKIVFSRVSLQPTNKSMDKDESDKLEDEYSFKGGGNYWDDMSNSSAIEKQCSQEAASVISREDVNDGQENPRVDKGKGKEVDRSGVEEANNRMLVEETNFDDVY
ncbi:7805_t:CDS:2, partial [Acaulospora colombiana]